MRLWGHMHNILDATLLDSFVNGELKYDLRPLSRQILR